MSLDFPAIKQLNQLFYAPNGIVYIWDGTKWDVYVKPEDLLNYWTRNALTEELSPRHFDDNLVISNVAIDRLVDLPE